MTTSTVYLGQQDLRKFYETDIKTDKKHYLNPLECLHGKVTSKTGQNWQQ